MLVLLWSCQKLLLVFDQGFARYPFLGRRRVEPGCAELWLKSCGNQRHVCSGLKQLIGVVVAAWPASESCALQPTAKMPRCARAPTPVGCVACSGPMPVSRASAGVTINNELPTIIKNKIQSRCKIGYFVKTHLRKLCVLLRSHVLLGVSSLKV